MATYELSPFHDDAAIAAAMGALLVRHDAVAPESFADVADRFDVDPARLEATVRRLGVVDELADIPRARTAVAARDSIPDCLSDRESITREYGGVRDSAASERVTETYELSFQSWLLVEATKSARETVERDLSGDLGGGVDTLRVATRATVGTAAFPERVLWIGVSYPVDESEPGSIPAVRTPPPFPFERLAAVAPATVHATVARGDETFHVRNIPVVPFREPHSY